MAGNEKHPSDDNVRSFADGKARAGGKKKWKGARDVAESEETIEEEVVVNRKVVFFSANGQKMFEYGNVRAIYLYTGDEVDSLDGLWVIKRIKDGKTFHNYVGQGDGVTMEIEEEIAGGEDAEEDPEKTD